MKTLSLKNLALSKVSISIENVVATAVLNQSIDIKKTIKNFPSSKYDPNKFPGAVIRLKQPRSVILAFKSGSIVCTGTKSEEMAFSAIQKFVSEIKNSNNLTNVSISDIKIVNMVASCNLGNKIHLEQTARTLPRSMYEPEQFPGIIHRLSHPNTVALIFASGRLVCVGAKSTQEIHLSVNTVRMELEERSLMAYENIASSIHF